VNSKPNFNFNWRDNQKLVTSQSNCQRFSASLSLVDVLEN